MSCAALLLAAPGIARAAVVDVADALIVPAGEAYRLGGEHTYLREVRIEGRLNVQGMVKLVAPLITVGASASIDASAQGGRGGAGGSNANGQDMGRGGEGPGAGASGQQSSNGNAGAGGGGGAGYGGAGAEGGFGGDANDHGAQGGQGGAGGRPYGQQDGRSIEVGSGGGGAGANVAGYVAVQAGSPGGGAIWLDGDIVVILGVLSADGGKGGDGANSDSWNHGSGGGGGASGGGILIEAQQLTITGRVHANGGNGGNGGPGDGVGAHGHTGSGGGGGGGGRIKLFALCREGQGTIEARGGQPGTGSNHDRPDGGTAGAEGTIHSAGDVQPDGCAGPPRIVSGSPYRVGENQVVELSLEGTRDPDQGEVTVAWDLDNDGAYDDSREWRVTVRYPEQGEYRVGVMAVDDEGEVAEGEVIIQVVNLPPVIRSDPPQRAMEDTPWRYDVVAEDPAGPEVDPLHLVLEEGPVGMTVQGMALVWTPTPAQAFVGRFQVELLVQDDDEGSARQAFQVEVTWLDRDADGMSDGWERQYGLDPADPDDAEQDMDGDGLTNLEEFLAGSDPTRFGKPDPPAIHRPEAGGEVSTHTPTLTVVNGFDPDAEPLIYEFELHGSPQLDNLLVSARQVPEGAGETTSWQIVRQLGENSRYWWRARCSDGLLSSDWSAPGEFFVNAREEPPSAITALAPADGVPVGTDRPELVVGAAMDPDHDELAIHFQLFTDAELSTIALERSDIAAAAGASTRWAVTPPLQEDTIYWWRARALDDTGRSGPWTEVRSFKVNQDNRPPPAPELVSPSPGSLVADLRPELSLRNVDDPDGDPVSYVVELAIDESFLSPDRFRQEDLPPGPNGFTTVSPGRLLDDTRYHWRAMATDGLVFGPWAVATFLVSRGNDPPGAPEPFEPANGGQVRTTTPILRVAAADDPEQQPLSYRFELSPLRDFSDESRIIASARLPADEEGGASWTTPVLEEGKKWYWRCQAHDPLRLTGPFSPVWQFQVARGSASSPPPVPEQRSPEDGAVTGPRPVLTAGTVQDPDGDTVRYVFRLSHDSTFTEELMRSISLEARGSTVSWELEDDLTAGKVYWQVRSSDGFSESDWSPAWSFTVDPSRAEDGEDEASGRRKTAGDGCSFAQTGAGRDGTGGGGTGGAGAAAGLLLLAATRLGLRRLRRG